MSCCSVQYSMKIAVQGCCHGELEKIYDVLQQVSEENGEKIDLLLCCGDFQAIRNLEDLCCMAVPNKYKDMGSFYKYYSGMKTAPVLTIFIGGNHEASNHLRELRFGGWVAPNIYYIGYCGIVNYGGLRIGGVSGIFNKGNYNKGHFESPPYDSSTMRSAYHTRSCDIFRLKQVVEDVDIMMSHDWPCGIHRHGDSDTLCRNKPHFRTECDTNTLGSPYKAELLDHLQPSYWFSAHLHCKFAAVYRHQNGNQLTKFLALDKCLPRGGYLQILDLPSLPAPYRLEYDLEWLSILKATEPSMYYSSTIWYPPTLRSFKDPIQKCRKEIAESFNGDFSIPHNFTATSKSYETGDRINLSLVAKAQVNPQTTAFCDKLGIQNPWKGSDIAHSSIQDSNPEEISLDSSDDEDIKETSPTPSPLQVPKESCELKPSLSSSVQSNITPSSSSSGWQDFVFPSANNPDEICLSDED